MGLGDLESDLDLDLESNLESNLESRLRRTHGKGKDALNNTIILHLCGFCANNSIYIHLLRKSRPYHWDLNSGSRERNPHSLCPSLNICSLEFGLGQVEEGGSKRGTAEALPKCVHFPQSLAPPMHLCVGRNLFGVNRLDATDCGF